MLARATGTDRSLRAGAYRLSTGAWAHTVLQELDILALHGFLHVLGYDHETDDGTMDRLERRLRRQMRGRA